MKESEFDPFIPLVSSISAGTGPATYSKSMSTTATEEKTDITQGYYNELISFLKGSHEGVENQHSDMPQAERLLRKTQAFYEKELSIVGPISEQRFGSAGLGDKIYDGITQAGANVASLFSGISKHDDSKKLRDTYVNVVASSVGLEMLYTTEVAGYGKSQHSEALLQLMKEHHELIMEYGHVIPEVVTKELVDEHGAAFTTAHTQEVVKDIQGTWN